MSSSNRVRIVHIPETVYGETPATGNFKDVRYTSESLSGTPATTESQTIRADRGSSGQIITGLEVGGDISMELARDPAIDDLFEAAMMSQWEVLAPIAVTADVDEVTSVIERTTGSFITDGLVRGDFVQVTYGAVNMLAAVKSVTALELTLIPEMPLTTAAAEAVTITRKDKIGIGLLTKSFSMEKIFEDLTTKAIDYRGMVVDTMSLDVAYGSVISMGVSFQGNDHKPVDIAADMMTNARTINAPATTPFLNGSIDMPIIATTATSADLTGDDMCLQSLSLELNNNNQSKTCIGKSAPEGFDAGTAMVSLSLSTYLKNEVWDFLEKKLTLDPFEILFAVRNSGGGYAAYLPSVQASFEDPSSGGINQQVSLELESTAKVGDNGEKALYLFKL